MDILKVSPDDVDAVRQLIETVSEVDILPVFSEQGKAEYKARVLPFDTQRFYALKISDSGVLLGFGALKEGSYLTHLFVSKAIQGCGMGRKLLEELMASTTASEMSLRASLNAAGFYESLGFTKTGPESDFNGIKFVPMKCVL
jgi:predicted GNAT family N-acyltransferase